MKKLPPMRVDAEMDSRECVSQTEQVLACSGGGFAAGAFHVGWDRGKCFSFSHEADSGYVYELSSQMMAGHVDVAEADSRHLHELSSQLVEGRSQ